MGKFLGKVLKLLYHFLGTLGKLLFHRVGIMAVLLLLQVAMYVVGLSLLRDSQIFDLITTICLICLCWPWCGS